MMRERRAVANGKTQRALRTDVYLNHDAGLDSSDRVSRSFDQIDRMPRYSRSDVDALPSMRFNRGLPPRPPR
ncbi:unnamed protein product [Strongylus vulgaris]|uniref:Uncharacterized protein n=1 Tax=Strongylus vulgaris TaxID=40348 RepID=A0A3P7KQR2_STRVU|nr:unnamed protein product [Strongylus vulgaris]